jgi:hypothetical protein
MGAGPVAVAGRTRAASAVVAVLLKTRPVRAAVSRVARPVRDAALAEALPLQLPRTVVAVAVSVMLRQPSRTAL